MHKADDKAEAEDVALTLDPETRDRVLAFLDACLACEQSFEFIVASLVPSAFHLPL
jgi:hypothetical protein